MLSEEDFIGEVGTALEMLPMMRQLSTATLAKMYMQLPNKVKQELSPIILRYAIKQRLLDPNPPKDIAFHIQLFRYLYPLENNTPVLVRELREDLRQRISRSDIFHDPSPQREEFMIPNHKQLPQGAFWHPNKMTEEQWMEHYRKLEIEISLINDTNLEPLTPEQVIQGKRWYRKSLAGFWLLGADSGGIARGWVARNKNLAKEMLEEAKATLGLSSTANNELDDESCPW